MLQYIDALKKSSEGKSTTSNSDVNASAKIKKLAYNEGYRKELLKRIIDKQHNQPIDLGDLGSVSREQYQNNPYEAVRDLTARKEIKDIALAQRQLRRKLPNESYPNREYEEQQRQEQDKADKILAKERKIQRSEETINQLRTLNGRIRLMDRDTTRGLARLADNQDRSHQLSDTISDNLYKLSQISEENLQATVRNGYAHITPEQIRTILAEIVEQMKHPKEARPIPMPTTNGDDIIPPRTTGHDYIYEEDDDEDRFMTPTVQEQLQRVETERRRVHAQLSEGAMPREEQRALQTQERQLVARKKELIREMAEGQVLRSHVQSALQPQTPMTPMRTRQVVAKSPSKLVKQAIEKKQLQLVTELQSTSIQSPQAQQAVKQLNDIRVAYDLKPLTANEVMALQNMHLSPVRQHLLLESETPRYPIVLANQPKTSTAKKVLQILKQQEGIGEKATDDQLLAFAHAVAPKNIPAPLENPQLPLQLAEAEGEDEDNNDDDEEVEQHKPKSTKGKQSTTTIIINPQDVQRVLQEYQAKTKTSKLNEINPQRFQEFMNSGVGKDIVIKIVNGKMTFWKKGKQDKLSSYKQDTLLTNYRKFTRANVEVPVPIASGLKKKLTKKYRAHKRAY